MDDMDQYRSVFLAESAEYIQQITDGLLGLEGDPADLTPVEVVFRGAHSLKGMAAAMGYQRTAELTHKMEGLMDRVRRGDFPPGPAVTGLMLAAVDLLRDLIDEESNGRHDIVIEDMVEALAEAAANASIASVEPDADVVDANQVEGTWHVSVTLQESCVLKAVRAYMVIKRLAHVGLVLETLPSEREIEDEHFDRTFEVIVSSEASADDLKEAVLHVSEVHSVDVESVAYVAPPAEESLVETALDAHKHSRELPRLSQAQTVRISIGHLDMLVDLVGELVILRSRLDQIALQRGDAGLQGVLEELHRVSTDLQYEIMQTRMVPVGNIFNRFPRMVRDLSVELGKRIEFHMEGLEIELDRTVLDEIGDPLVHLLRNSIDHGIEPSAERTAAGKSPAGNITLRASRERDHVAITVSDDGRGIDPEIVWREAVERNVVNPADRADYDVSSILLLTCLPGLSTQHSANRISGRGVGMDAVKGKIEYLGGTVQIHSVVGEGTELMLRLPLTLAIIQALLVETDGRSFALPLSSVNEVYAAEELNMSTVDGFPVVILRTGDVVPLVRLDSLLFEGDLRESPDPRSSVVLIEHGSEQRALAVDGLGGRKEIVVKPLSRLFRDAKGFSGATILGDGRVMLILDPRTLFSGQES
jgi:two-component system chemotaxis sensor kinase CheA